MTARPVRLRHRVEYVALRAVVLMAEIMPEGVSYRGVAALGRLYYRCSKFRQRVAMRMLRNAFPDRAERDLARVGRIATGNMFKVAIDTLRLGKFVAGGLGERIDYTPNPDALLRGPFIGVTPHLGSWEVAAAAVARQRGECHVVVQTMKNPLVQAFLERTRGAAGLRLHPRRGGIRGLVNALSEGKIGLQAVDQNQRLRGVFAPFFGEIASCERSAATLALRKGYPLQIGIALRTGVGFRFKMAVKSAVVPPRTVDLEADVERLVRQINAELEELVLRHPEQYLWIHDRYRTRPKNESKAPAPNLRDSSSQNLD